MLGGLQNISLTAFICAFRAYRRNGVRYRHDKNYKLAQALGLSTNTVKKYFLTCKELGLTRDSKGNTIFLKLKEVFPVLFPDYHDQTVSFFNHVRFFKGFEKIPDFKTYLERIKFALAKTNFNQQQWQIDKKQEVIDIISNNRKDAGSGRKYLAALKKHKANSARELKRMLTGQTTIVTGKSHIAKLLGCSSPTASKLLRKWTHLELIYRKVKATFISCLICPASFASIKVITGGIGAVIPSKCGKGYWWNQGSEITLPAM